MTDPGGMVDISHKDVTIRTATACGKISLGKEAFDVVKQGTCKKGDILTTAKIAAVNAAKQTPAVIPLCHPILIENVKVNFELNEDDTSVTATVTVKSQGRTGVEMEALCAVSIACLTIYDMLKYTGKAMTIKQVYLIEKTGGKSGDYKRNN